VFEYTGSDEKALQAQGLTFADVDPVALAANHDIIFMSLATLTGEFHRVNAAEQAAKAAAGTRAQPFNRPRSTRARGKTLPGGYRRSDQGQYWMTDSDIEAELEEEEKERLAAAAGGGGDRPFTHSWGSAKYITFPPPIMCVNFALLAVDETQKIEAEGVSQALSMCMRLKVATSLARHRSAPPSLPPSSSPSRRTHCQLCQARRRLCVSGTPLGSSRATDLLSLCQFMHLEPYTDRGAWQRVFGDRSLVRGSACLPLPVHACVPAPLPTYPPTYAPVWAGAQRGAAQPLAGEHVRRHDAAPHQGRRGRAAQPAQAQGTDSRVPFYH
jgi:hypothetical protein